MIFRFVCSCFLLLANSFNSPAAYGQTADTMLPSAWAWQVSSQHRTIYLVGEMHGFLPPKNTRIDYQLGFDIYNRVREIWTEVDQANPTTRYATKPLPSRLRPETWRNVRAAIFSLAPVNSPTSPAFLEAQNKFLQGMEVQSAALAFVNLSQASYVKYLSSQPQTRLEPGLTSKLASEEKNKNQKRLSEIETSTLPDDVYHEQCDNDENAEELVQAGLKYFDLDFFWNSRKTEEFQKLFADSTTTDEQLLSYWLKAYPIHSLLLQCNIKPRNLAWLPKIVDALQTNGPPIAVLVGAMHMVGEGGLLALLKEKGFSDSRRIYSVPKP